MRKEDKLKLRTLADIALAMSIKPEVYDGGQTFHFDPGLRSTLLHARRFILDTEASEFLAHLFMANFGKIYLNDDGEVRINRTPKQAQAFDATRCLARLPHKQCWFEYDRGAFDRTFKSYGGDLINPENEDCRRIGWLLRQHNGIETAFRASVIAEWTKVSDSMQQPFDMMWVTDNDTPLPWNSLIPKFLDLGMEVENFYLATGFAKRQFPSEPRVGLTENYLSPGFAVIENKPVSPREMVAMFGTELRKIITLLACINDIPFGVRVVEPAHGYMVGRNYRKFLDHSVITLNLPKGRDPQKLARHIIALSRRRAHQVRGHWRRDWRHEGNKLWIKEHQRGDASLGFVTHDYEVTHDTE